MKHRIFRPIYFIGIALLGVVIFNSCKKELPLAPTVTLSETQFSGKTGESVSVDASVDAPGGLTSLEVTKYIGTDIDSDFGSGGTETVSSTSYTLNYELNAEGLTTPIRFNFKATDEEGQTGTADFVVTTEASLEYVLTTFNWQLNSKRGKCLESEPESEMIFECEKDNVYSFNTDGSFAIDYGALTGSGGGTCDFDGLDVPETWSLDEENGVLTLTTYNAFDPASKTTQSFNILGYSLNELNASQTVDLSFFGCVIWDWKFDFIAKPK